MFTHRSTLIYLKLYACITLYYCFYIRYDVISVSCMHIVTDDERGNCSGGGISLESTASTRAEGDVGKCCSTYAASGIVSGNLLTCARPGRPLVYSRRNARNVH